MSEENQKEIEDKVFGKITGKIIPETVVVGDDIYDVSFDFKSKDSMHRFRITDRRVVSKLCQLYNVSHRNTVNALRDKGEVLTLGLETKLKKAIKKSNRKVVLLTDKDVKPVSIVSEQHQQLPLSEAYEIVDNIAKSNKARFISRRETDKSYIIDYEVTTTDDMSVRVTAYLGRNDALGRAGIRFEGGGHIFVCSNMIVPHIDKDITLSTSELSSVKIVHTTNVGDRLKSQLVKSFEYARKNATLLNRKFVEAKNIKMDRKLQKHCIELIRLKHSLPDKWNTEILTRLYEENESLFGLSQAMTYVASHIAEADSEISKRLQRLGGQVILLGKSFVTLVTKSIKKCGLEVPKLQVSS